MVLSAPDHEGEVCCLRHIGRQRPNIDGRNDGRLPNMTPARKSMRRAKRVLKPCREGEGLCAAVHVRARQELCEGRGGAPAENGGEPSAARETGSGFQFGNTGFSVELWRFR